MKTKKQLILKKKKPDKSKITRLVEKYQISTRTAYKWVAAGLVDNSCNLKYKQEGLQDSTKDIVEDCLWLLQNVENYSFEGSILPKINPLKGTLGTIKYNYIISKLNKRLNAANKRHNL